MSVWLWLLGVVCLLAVAGVVRVVIAWCTIEDALDVELDDVDWDQWQPPAA